MVMQPRLVGNLIPGRSNWKAIGRTDLFILQHHPRQASHSYRIITRGFPHYQVAEGDILEALQQELVTLSRRARGAIQGKITSKKISTWLKRGSVIMSSINTPGQDDDDILDEDEEEADDEEEDDPHIHLLLHHQEEEGYISDTSTISHEGIIMTTTTTTTATTVDDLTLHDSTDRDPGASSRRLMRRAISLEDINTGSAIHRNQHILDPDSPPERPSSSASMSLPVASDTLSPYQPNNHTIYHQYYRHHQSLEKSSIYNALNNDDNQYSPYHLDHDSQGRPIRTMSPDADMDDLSLMEDAKSTFHSHLAQHDISKDEAAVATRGPLGWLNAAPLLDALVNWIEGPPNRPQPKKNPNEKPNPILEIPFQFIALLTYPEPDPKAGDKMSLAMVRETSFVRQRRKTLMLLTTYTLVVRYCSFDFFLLVLFASNCGMLFLMKNSARMNVNMAKRAVGQRVGWAKQWAGGFFKRSNGGLANSNMNYTGNETMPLQQGITASNASSNKSVSYISSTAQTSESMMLRSGETSTSIIGEKLDSTQDNSPLIKRRGLFGKRKNYTVSLAPSQSVANSSIVSPTSAIGDGLNGDDVSVMTGRTKRGFFKRSTNNSSASRSATAPPSTIIDAQSPTPTTPKRPIHSSTPTSAVTTILPSKNGITILSTSPQPQSQSLSQLDLAMLPPRSPSPSALRKEFPVRSSGSSSATVAVAAAAPTASVPVLQAGSNQIGSHAVNSSSASSGASSPNYSPRTASFINPSIVATSSMANTSAATVSPVSTTITTTTTPTISTGRSLASAINPRSLLSSFTSQSHKQLQQSTTSPVTPTFPPHPHPIITNNSPATSTASSSTVPISPRPIKAAGLRTGLFLASSLSTSKLSNVLGGGSNRSSNDLTSHSNANGGGRGSMFEEEEKLEVTMEYQLQQHQQQPQFNPHRRASTTSTVGMIKYSELPSPDALMYREYPPQHPLAFGTTGQDPFLHHSHQPMWQMNSAAPRSGPLSGFKNDELAMARELNGRGGIGGGGMREDLLDPVTSAAADAMDGFGHEN